MYFFAYRQENLGPYFKLLGILIATFISQIKNKSQIFHSCSLNFFYQNPTHTRTAQDMQYKIIIIEYMLEQLTVNFHLNFSPLSSGSRYLCP